MRGDYFVFDWVLLRWARYTCDGRAFVGDRERVALNLPLMPPPDDCGWWEDEIRETARQ